MPKKIKQTLKLKEKVFSEDNESVGRRSNKSKNGFKSKSF